MALRVLLADESNTIKRVIELSLQDYAVEVKPVHIGTDVAQIAKSYRPDIIFIDILLQKLSGYEVAKQLKSDPQLQRIPSVLMWSGFMDFDEQKFKLSQADAKLEKPFNSDTLRGLVQGLVAKTKNQTLSQFIKLPDFVEDTNAPHASVAPTPITQANIPHQNQNRNQNKNVISIDNVEALEIDTGSGQDSENQNQNQPSWNMDSFEKIESFAEKEEFAQVRLGKKPPHTPHNQSGFSPADYPSADSWIQQDINKFRAPEPVDEEKTLMESLQRDERHEEESEDPYEFTQAPASSKKIILEDITPRPTSPKQASAPIALKEEVITAQAREIIEQAVWKIVPEIAERMVREEIQRLLKEKDNELHID